ncbi:glucose-methanol-choline oxidoreductase-like protein [Halenospora varia]|nr:glucose-methanol-choline oxidoreductase-like protein [Halenospora varia]
MSSIEYDFIIVGGGTSGLVVATRLTEDPNTSVLVLEAGEDHSADPRVITPALWPSLLGTEVDWGYLSEAQTGLNGKRIPLSQGRLLGGSSALNGLAFVAPSRFSVDAWEKFGNPGWNWQSLSSYFQKSCTLTKPSDAACTHLGLDYVDETTSANFKGPVQASFAEEVSSPLPKAWVESFNNLGYTVSGDPFTGEAVGGYVNAMNIHPVTKQRSHAGNAYYEPARARTNLTIVTSAVVEEILLERQVTDVVAKGVAYTKDGKKQTATASKDVILAAGVFNTPKLLELSGIGSTYLLNFEVADGIATVDGLARKDMAAIGAAMATYQRDQSGLFATGGNFAGGFLPVTDFLTPDGKKDLKILLGSQILDDKLFSKDHSAFVESLLQTSNEGSGGFFSYSAQGNFIPEVAATGSNEIIGGSSPGNFLTICCMLLHPLSRGSSHITSSDPAAKMAIDPAYLSHQLDLEVLARHVRFIGKIASSEPLASFLKPGGRRSNGAPTNLEDLELVKEYVKKAALSAWHPTSTCAMLPLEKGGVVDPELKVYGTKNLRIVDASVIPLATRGNSQTTVYAVAEKAADLIKATYDIKV